MSTEITVVETVDRAELMDLYGSVGWVAYTQDPDRLVAAVHNSTYVVTARISGELVGLARGLSDGASIFYLQDILVRPDRQHRDVGRALLNDCLRRFDHVRQKLLLTDDEPAQHRFYESMGYRDTRLVENVALHAFVKIEGLDLEARKQTGPAGLERQDVGD